MYTVQHYSTVQCITVQFIEVQISEVQCSEVKYNSVERPVLGCKDTRSLLQSHNLLTATLPYTALYWKAVLWKNSNIHKYRNCEWHCVLHCIVYYTLFNVDWVPCNVTVNCSLSTFHLVWCTEYGTLSTRGIVYCALKTVVSSHWPPLNVQCPMYVLHFVECTVHCSLPWVLFDV